MDTDEIIEEIPRSNTNDEVSGSPRIVGIPIQMGQFPFGLGQLFNPAGMGQSMFSNAFPSMSQNNAPTTDDDKEEFSLSDHIDECNELCINPYSVQAYKNWLRKVLPCNHDCGTADYREIEILRYINANKTWVQWDDDMLQWVFGLEIHTRFGPDSKDILMALQNSLSKCDHCKVFFKQK
jgi:hypothetical protein